MTYPSDDDGRAVTFLNGAFGESPGGIIARDRPQNEYCCVCGKGLDSWDSTKLENYCQTCCPDHDYVYVEWDLHECRYCGAARPWDAY